MRDLQYGLESAAAGLVDVLAKPAVETFRFTYHAVRDILLCRCGGRLDDIVRFLAPEGTVVPLSYPSVSVRVPECVDRTAIKMYAPVNCSLLVHTDRPLDDAERFFVDVVTYCRRRSICGPDGVAVPFNASFVLASDYLCVNKIWLYILTSTAPSVDFGPIEKRRQNAVMAFNKSSTELHLGDVIENRKIGNLCQITRRYQENHGIISHGENNEHFFLCEEYI